MNLKKFKIKNYKSIIDSGDCYLNDTISIFAGKNESGKTSILEALEDFDTEKNIREEAKSIQSPDKKPEISVTFTLKKDMAKKILKEIESPVEVTKNIDLEVIKIFPDRYSFRENTLENEIFDSEKIEKVQKSIEDKWNEVKKIREENTVLGGELFDFDFSNFANSKNLFIEFKNTVTPNIQSIVDEKIHNNFLKLFSEIELKINNLENFFTTKEKFLESLKKRIPKFILFKSFENIFPDKILLAELEENEWIKDLSVISDLKPDIIKSADDRDKKKHKVDINIKLNKDYKKFWSQDDSILSVDWDSEHLYVWIQEDDQPYELRLRSKGRQWHLSFYIKISARANENVSNIILIDEPGLFLHAKAQKNILEKLEDSAKKAQLIFSTHSPYLLEADKLNRIRLIHKDKIKGTTIENKVHALADKETLTPILTAIGLELNAGISELNKVNNVVVEGPSDVYYLNAFKKLLNNENNVNFIFGGGAGNMSIIGTILHGWGAKVVYLYDNDQGEKDGKKNLKDNWLVTKDLILSISDNKKKESIEDIFSSSDFRKFVLPRNASKTYSESNSEYVKKESIDKVLLAKKFLEACQSGDSIKLDETTKEIITKLFEKIEDKLKSIKDKF